MATCRAPADAPSSQSQPMWTGSLSGYPAETMGGEERLRQVLLQQFKMTDASQMKRWNSSAQNALYAHERFNAIVYCMATNSTHTQKAFVPVHAQHPFRPH